MSKIAGGALLCCVPNLEISMRYASKSSHYSFANRSTYRSCILRSCLFSKHRKSNNSIRKPPLSLAHRLGIPRVAEGCFFLITFTLISSVTSGSSPSLDIRIDSHARQRSFTPGSYSRPSVFPELLHLSLMHREMVVHLSPRVSIVPQQRMTVVLVLLIAIPRREAFLSVSFVCFSHAHHSGSKSQVILEARTPLPSSFLSKTRVKYRLSLCPRRSNHVVCF